MTQYEKTQYEKAQYEKTQYEKTQYEKTGWTPGGPRPGPDRRVGRERDRAELAEVGRAGHAGTRRPGSGPRPVRPAVVPVPVRPIGRERTVSRPAQPPCPQPRAPRSGQLMLVRRPIPGGPIAGGLTPASSGTHRRERVGRVVAGIAVALVAAVVVVGLGLLASVAAGSRGGEAPGAPDRVVGTVGPRETIRHPSGRLEPGARGSDGQARPGQVPHRPPG